MTATLAALPDMADAPVSPAPVAAEHAQMWALIQRAQAGDREAFGEVWKTYHNVVFRSVMHRVHNVHTAEEITSDVFLAAFRALGSVSYEGKGFLAWLHTTARNRCIDFYRSGRAKYELIDNDTISTDRPDQGQHVEHAVLRGIDSVRLHAALKKLSDEQRRAIVATYYEGMTSAEAGALLGKTPEAVKALTLRARRQLIHLLAETRS